MDLRADMVHRGVYRLPAFGPHGETVIYAADHNSCMLRDGMIYVAPGDNPFLAEAELWSRLNEEDPLPEELEPWQGVA